jgi:hypothetical protein
LECFTKGNFDIGLPMLAKGSDETLRTLAQKDLAGPETMPEQAALGDAWWARAEKETGVSRQRIRERAAHWYSRAVKETTGLTRVRMERRLEELGRAVIVAPPKSALPEGLLGWWKLDDGHGTKIVDSSGRGHHGTMTQDGIWIDGRKGKTLRFQGRRSQVVVTDTEALRITGDLTIALWYRLDGRAPDWIRLAGKGAGTTRNYGLWLEHPPGNRILFQQGDSRTNCDVYGTTTSVTGTWVHLAGVVQGTTQQLYVNGKKEGSLTRPTPPPTSMDPLTIGAADFHQGFLGLLDDVRIYNRALTEPEIEQLAAP